MTQAFINEQPQPQTLSSHSHRIAPVPPKVRFFSRTFGG